jgi:hypothetical protein
MRQRLPALEEYNPQQFQQACRDKAWDAALEPIALLVIEQATTASKKRDLGPMD